MDTGFVDSIQKTYEERMVQNYSDETLRKTKENKNIKLAKPSKANSKIIRTVYQCVRVKDSMHFKKVIMT